MEREIKISFVYAYYENPEMFLLQQRTWKNYSLELRKQMEVLVTDDCSKKYPILKAIDHDNSYQLSVFRIQEKVAWNWLEARNIGAHHAKGKWILLTDMDHMVRGKVFHRLLKKLPDLNPEVVYQFSRCRAPGMEPYKFHNDSFLVTRDLFWKCGGYDEDYAGQYGTSGMFRRRLFQAAKGHILFHDLSLVLYPREVIPDASTTNLARKNGRDPNAISRISDWKQKNGRNQCFHFLRPFERIF